MLLKGKVTDSTGGIPAPVYKSDESGKNLGVGTLADIDGNYSLDNVNVGEYITASMVGLKPQTQKVTTSPLNFNLSASSSVNIKPFEVIADRIIKPLPPKENWFKRNQKLVVIASVSLIALIMGIVIIKAAKK